jgi:hypothetical protein
MSDRMLQGVATRAASPMSVSEGHCLRTPGAGVDSSSRSSTFLPSPFLFFYSFPSFHPSSIHPSIIRSFRYPSFLPSGFSRDCFHARLLADAKLVRVGFSSCRSPILWAFSQRQSRNASRLPDQLHMSHAFNAPFHALRVSHCSFPRAIVPQG